MQDSVTLIFIIGMFVTAGIMWLAGFDGFVNKDDERETDGEPGRSVNRKQFQPTLNRNEMFRVIRRRQSGNVENLGIMTGAEAVRVVKQTFQRSMSDEFLVRKDTPTALTVDRGYIHMRGTQEGKKIRRVIVEQV